MLLDQVNEMWLMVDSERVSLQQTRSFKLGKTGATLLVASDCQVVAEFLNSSSFAPAVVNYTGRLRTLDHSCIC